MDLSFCQIRYEEEHVNEQRVSVIHDAFRLLWFLRLRFWLCFEEVSQVRNEEIEYLELCYLSSKLR